MSDRILSWFSCGAASAVAAKLAVEKYGDKCEIIYCNTLASEHPDNARFMSDIERWMGKRVMVISSEKYTSVDDVFEKTRYMSGIAGARCTTELKKIPRRLYQRDDDIHIFGFTVEEQNRIDNFEGNNPELNCEWILRDKFIRKVNCFDILRRAGIALPKMYELGFRNNNCIGCVKATSPAYWNLTRRHFPNVFEQRAIRSREIGCRLARLNGQRIFLDELPPDAGGEMENVSCGPQCGLFG
jgi:3'-phosphoadenosine 5'-phosphosulfate sulfotransferase (PAPS reductase)/FAD synthetase